MSEQTAEVKGTESSGIGRAFVLHTIRLNEGADAKQFETFMLKEIFPVVNTRDKDFNPDDIGPDQHFLLANSDVINQEYLWMLQLEYSIVHTPLPNWLHNRADSSYESVKEKIEAFAMKVSSETLYDVKEWHQRLGLK